MVGSQIMDLKQSNGSISIKYMQDIQEEYLSYLQANIIPLSDSKKQGERRLFLQIPDSNEYSLIQSDYISKSLQSQNKFKSTVFCQNKQNSFGSAQQQTFDVFNPGQQNLDYAEIPIQKYKQYLQQQQLQQSLIAQVQKNYRQLISTQLFSAIGLVRPNWYNKEGRLSCYSYGSGFLLSQHLLLTCAHNLCDESNMKYANQIIFIPNWDGHIQTNTPQFKSADDKYHRNKPLIHKVQTFSIIPLINELCLVMLKEPIKLQAYITIGELQLNAGQEIQICGYPNRSYNSLIRLSLVELKRTTLIGNVVSVQGNIINHNLCTEVGFSGSPILATDKMGKTVAVGMHSHRGQKNINCGLFFNSQVICLMQQFQKQLSLQYNLQSPITFSKESEFSQGCSFTYVVDRQQSLIQEGLEEKSQNAQLQLSQEQKQCVEQLIEESKDQHYLHSDIQITSSNVCSSDEHSLNSYQAYCEQIQEKHDKLKITICQKQSKIDDCDDYIWRNSIQSTQPSIQSDFSSMQDEEAFICFEGQLIHNSGYVIHLEPQQILQSK